MSDEAQPAPAAPAQPPVKEGWKATTQEELVDEIYRYAANLLNAGSARPAVEQKLAERGLDRESIAVVMKHLFQARAVVLKKAGLQNMVYGALWCVAGAFATALTSKAGFGVIFWGAVVFGLIQAGRGVYQYFKGMIGTSWQG